jgi:hypothetical protein
MQVMKADTLSPTTEAAIWTRVIHPDGELTPAAARAILQLEFDAADRRLMHKLSEKARQGKLTEEEQFAIDNFERVGTTLAILKSKARKLLRRAARRRT